jgi:type I restriction enzyme S subunit
MSVSRHSNYLANLPEAWGQAPIGEIGEVCAGGTPSRANPSYWDGSIPWVTPSELTDIPTKEVVGTREKITEAGLADSSATLLPAGSLIVTTRATIGNVAVAGMPMCTNQGFKNVVLGGRADVNFYYHLLKFISREFIRLASGTTFLEISARDFSSVVVPVPPLSEQRRIAEILDAADDAIRQTERVIAKLKAVEAGLLHDLLTRGLDEHGHLRDPQAHPEQFKDSPLGRIPREWGVSTIGDIAIHVGSGATPRGGNEVYKTEGVVFIRSQNVTFEGLLLDDVVYIDDDTHRTMGRSEVFPHDVLLNITGASIGRCCPLPKGLGVANVNQHVCAIRLPEPTHEGATFLSSVLASEIGQHQIHQLNAGGNRQGLNYEQLRSFIIPWPPPSERAGITRALDTHDSRIRAEEATLANLCQVKRGLMHDLLTGKVRVSASWNV